MIRGFFKNDAGYINAHLISPYLGIDETVEFLVDTGASRTTLLDKDAIYLGLDYNSLKKHSQNLSGIGGTVETFIIEDSILILDKEQINLPIFIVRHPLERLNKEDKIKILRIPSLLGRDVINKFKLIFDKEENKVILENGSRILI